VAERMTSPAEARTLAAVFGAAIGDLRRGGFDDGQIGAAMIGIGGGLTIAAYGERGLDDVLAALVAAARGGGQVVQPGRLQ